MDALESRASGSEASALAENVLEELWFGDAEPGRSRQQASQSLASALAIATSVRLLRMANSAVYAPKRACESVADSVLRLGSRNVAGILAEIAVFGMFSDLGGLGARVRDHCAGAGS